MTPEEASKKWCPMVRVECVPPNENHGELTITNKPSEVVDDSTAYCIGPACMRWRWRQRLAFDSLDRNDGYCGLAGKDGAP